MALPNLHQRRGGNFSRLPLIARGQLPELWKHSVWTKVMESENRLSALNYINSLLYADTPVIARSIAARAAARVCASARSGRPVP